MSFKLDDKGVWQAIKTPDAELEYSIDWTALHGDETSIASSTWSVDGGGLTVGPSDINGFVTTVILSGGELGSSYTVRNHIVTTTGKRDDRFFRIRIKDRSQ